MATSSGSTSIAIKESGSEESLMEVRKRKRMISNRESARRSRMRKQQHLDDLTVQIAHLRRTNGQMLASLNMTTQQLMSVEGENSVIRAQVVELGRTLESLNEVMSFVGGSYGNLLGDGPDVAIDGMLENSWGCVYLNQPIMAYSDALVGLL